MRDKRTLKFGDIVNSNAIIINGDVSIDGEVFNNVKNIFFEILRDDFLRYSGEAIIQAKIEINNLMLNVFERLVKEQLTQLTEKFKSPSIQVFLHDTLVGYITNENDDVKDLIVDILIDRLKIDNVGTEKAILNDAIKLIPNLNSSTSSLIALLNLRNQVAIPAISFMLESFFMQISPIINNSCNINNIDIEYIKQANCTQQITGIYHIDSYENHLLKQYDLYFRQKGSIEIFNNFRNDHPEIMHQVNDMGTCMFCLIDKEKKWWRFCDVNTNLFYKRLIKRRQEYLIPLIEKLKATVPPLSNSEVREYLCNINMNWKYVFDLLNSSELNTVSLNVLGSYIGSKIISKYTNGKALSFTSISNPVAL
ncbi:MAG: hypothetical protein ITF98_06875 [Fermentimonas sp.]|nr:hypothetical protein [Fermentimonas sp.]